MGSFWKSHLWVACLCSLAVYLVLFTATGWIFLSMLAANSCGTWLGILAMYADEEVRRG